VTRRTLKQRARAWLPILLAAGTAVGFAGCGGQDDTTRGRELFVTKCGTCHQLAEAGTSANIGPNLDAAFAQARAVGMDSDTIEGVVKFQIENPRPNNGNAAVSMPADLVTGTDLDDVAAYVASVAGVPGAKPPTAPGGPGGQVFAQNGCGGCHTYTPAKSSGTTGPDLDSALKGQSDAEVMESIVDPNAKITPGYPANVMPTNFEQTIDSKQLKLLVAFLLGGGSAK
jgi:mono/diheme cytochrome c family protein